LSYTRILNNQAPNPNDQCSPNTPALEKLVIGA